MNGSRLSGHGRSSILRAGLSQGESHGELVGLVPAAGCARRADRHGPRGGGRQARERNRNTPLSFSLDPSPPKGDDMRGLLLWLIGIPIPVIILLYLFHVI
jgi:hypothetical protein